MALIHLIRHARPVLSGVILGQLDPPLDRNPPPSNLPVITVLSSPLRRASETAASLFPGHTVRIAPELAEIGMGEWEGQTWSQIETTWPELAAAKLADWLGVTPPGGEPWSRFASRVAAAWDLVLAAPPPIAVVAHLGVNSVLRQLATGEDPTFFRQDYGEVLSLDVP